MRHSRRTVRPSAVYVSAAESSSGVELESLATGGEARHESTTSPDHEPAELPSGMSPTPDGAAAALHRQHSAGSPPRAQGAPETGDDDHSRVAPPGPAAGDACGGAAD